MVHDTAPADPVVAFYRGATYTLDESVGYLLRQVVASLNRQIDVELKELDLTAFQWAPLLMIGHGKAGTAAELARVLDVDNGAVTRMIDRLETKGLLRRERCTEDRRVAHLKLTAAGAQAAAGIPDCLSRALNQHLRGFSNPEFAALKRYLRRMLENGSTAA